jgi:hypothetical protein
MDEFARSMKQLETFNLIQNMGGKYSQPDGTFVILPTIQIAVSPEKSQRL